MLKSSLIAFLVKYVRNGGSFRGCAQSAPSLCQKPQQQAVWHSLEAPNKSGCLASCSEGWLLVQQIVFFEEGEPLIDGEPGDLKFVVSTLPHARFWREGDDLWHNTTISLEAALIGFTTQIEHLDGRKVGVKSEGVTLPGEVRTLRGEGMPLFENGHKFGDLHLRFTVAFPASLTEAQKSLVRKMQLKHDEL